jgi:hypothetical protein
MNIQDEMQKIHHEFGVSEMANYKIEQFIDNLIKEDRKQQLILNSVGNCKRESLDNFSELLQKVVNKTKASDTGLMYVDAGDIMQDICDNYIVIKK